MEAFRTGTLVSFLRKQGSGGITASQEGRRRYFGAWAYVIRGERVEMGNFMMMRGKLFLRIGLLLLLAATASRGETPAAGAAGQGHGGEAPARLTQRPEDGRGQAVFGSDTVVNKGWRALAKP